MLNINNQFKQKLNIQRLTIKTIKTNSIFRACIHHLAFNIQRLKKTNANSKVKKNKRTLGKETGNGNTNRGNSKL